MGRDDPKPHLHDFHITSSRVPVNRETQRNMAAPCVKIFESDNKVAEELCLFVIQKANDAIRERDKFLVGFSG